jgi:hypothetical protein
MKPSGLLENMGALDISGEYGSIEISVSDFVVR